MNDIFSKTVQQLFAHLGDHQVMCLATSANGRVTARSMSFIITGGKCYFQTNIHMPKYRQIAVNHNVAVCWQNVQIEGVCRELGSPSLAQNSFFTALFRKYYPSPYEKYSGMDGETVFEVTPVRISVWDYENGNPYQEFWNFEKQTYRKEYYDCSK